MAESQSAYSGLPLREELAEPGVGSRDGGAVWGPAQYLAARRSLPPAPGRQRHLPGFKFTRDSSVLEKITDPPINIIRYKCLGCHPRAHASDSLKISGQPCATPKIPKPDVCREDFNFKGQS